MKKPQRHEVGTIVAWTNDGEISAFDSLNDYHKELVERGYDCTIEEVEKFCGTIDELASGETYFRYGIDEEATKGYDDAWTDAEAAEEDE